MTTTVIKSGTRREYWIIPTFGAWRIERHLTATSFLSMTWSATALVEAVDIVRGQIAWDLDRYE